MCDVCDVCCEPSRQTGITRQPTGVWGRKTYGRVGVNKENTPGNSLDSPTRFDRAKNTNVKRIGKIYLIIRGVLCTVIYGTFVEKRSLIHGNTNVIYM